MKNINGLWRKKFLLIVVPFVFSAQVHANNVGVLDEIQGTVMVDRGEGYSIAHRGEALQAGDRIVTMDASGAVLKHSDGCVARLAENSMVKMEQVSVCKNNNGSLKKSGPFVAAAIGVRPPPTTATDYLEEPIFEAAEEMAVEGSILDEDTKDTDFEDPAFDNEETLETALEEPVDVMTNIEEIEVVEEEISPYKGAGILSSVSKGSIIAIGAGAAALLAAVAGGSSASDH
ncbi:MAG: hypothetical protein L3J70_11480 [Gammaproteobacteria bacterium]|nr:hypothetical protein [Gammaproteobacteria bacterium]